MVREIYIHAVALSRAHSYFTDSRKGPARENQRLQEMVLLKRGGRSHCADARALLPFPTREAKKSFMALLEPESGDIVSVLVFSFSSLFFF